MEARIDPEFWQGRQVFVTGHTGFKGSWLSSWLADLGASVTGYALPTTTKKDLFEAIGLEARLVHCVGDVRDAAHLETCLQNCAADIVFHLAAQPLVRASYEQPIETYATNVIGTANLLDAIRRCPTVRAVVNVTTDKVYRDHGNGHAYREVDELGGHDPYSSSKACSELITDAYRRSYFTDDIGLATARAGNVLGGGDWAADRIIPDAVRAFARGETLVVRNPAAIRPWQHVTEPLGAYLVLAQACVQNSRAASQAWNFGPAHEEVAPVGTVVESFRRCWGNGARWTAAEPDSQALHEAKVLTLDATKARDQLGWRPHIDLQQCLAWTAEWYVAQQGGASRERLRQIVSDQVAAHPLNRRA